MSEILISNLFIMILFLFAHIVKKDAWLCRPQIRVGRVEEWGQLFPISFPLPVLGESGEEGQRAAPSCPAASVPRGGGQPPSVIPGPWCGACSPGTEKFWFQIWRMTMSSRKLDINFRLNSDMKDIYKTCLKYIYVLFTWKVKRKRLGR